jgi:hypothetical protein
VAETTVEPQPGKYVSINCSNEEGRERLANKKGRHGKVQEYPMPSQSTLKYGSHISYIIRENSKSVSPVDMASFRSALPDDVQTGTGAARQ